MMPRGPSENPRASADLNSGFPVPVPVRARIRGMGDLIDKTLRGGDRRAPAALFDQYRDRLRRKVELRRDPRLRGWLDVVGDLDAYLADPKLPPLLWLRVHVGRRLTTLHRQHLGTRLRYAGLEISLNQVALPRASSTALAPTLLGGHTSPTQSAHRAERMLQSRESLQSLDPIAREVVALRHFEQLGPHRGGAGARDHAGSRGEAILPRPEAGQGRAGDAARRLGGSLTMSTSSGSRDSWPLRRAGQGVRRARIAGASGRTCRSTSTACRRWPTRSARRSRPWSRSSRSSQTPASRRRSPSRTGPARSRFPTPPARGNPLRPKPSRRPKPRHPKRG